MVQVNYVAKKGKSTRESWVRSFIITAFINAETVREFETIFSNLLTHHCDNGDKFAKDTKNFYRFSKTDKEGEFSDDDYSEMTEGYIVYSAESTFKVICHVKDIK